MQLRSLISVVAAASAGAVAAVGMYGLSASRAHLPTGVSVPIVAGTASDARIFLTGDQIKETRNRLLWPTEMRSLLKVGHPLTFGEWLWNDDRLPTSRPTVRIDLKAQLLSVSRGGDEIGTAVILYGATDHETPVGRFPILSKDADYHSIRYEAAMPYALRLTPDGVAIHGSDVKQGRATHGCIGLPLAFAKKLFAVMNKGDEVLIIKS